MTVMLIIVTTAEEVMVTRTCVGNDDSSGADSDGDTDRWWQKLWTPQQ